MLALIACLILIGGWLVRPRDIPQSPAPVPTETELEQLARRSARRAVETSATYFAGVAREVETSVAYVRGAGLNGVAWDDIRIVTPPLPRGRERAPVTVVAAGAEHAGHPTMAGPDLPLATLRMPNGVPVLNPARRAQSLPKSGDWIVAVWHTGTAPAFTVGNFGGPAPVRCGATTVQELVSSLSLPSVMAGGGVFDIDGGLLAVVLPCRGRLVAVAATSIQSILDRPESVETQLLDRFGLRLSPLSVDEARYFKAGDGLLVREVWTGYPADASGLQPGDIVTAASGVPVMRTEDLAAHMTSAETPIELTIAHGSTRLARTLVQTPGPLPDTASHGTGLALERPPTAYPIESVRPESRAARAGIQPGDRLVGIDRAVPRSADQATRLLERISRPMWIDLIRDGRRLGVLVQ